MLVWVHPRLLQHCIYLIIAGLSHLVLKLLKCACAKREGIYTPQAGTCAQTGNAHTCTHTTHTSTRTHRTSTKRQWRIHARAPTRTGKMFNGSGTRTGKNTRMGTHWSDTRPGKGPCPPKTFLKGGAPSALLSTRLCAPLKKGARRVFRLRH